MAAASDSTRWQRPATPSVSFGSRLTARDRGRAAPFFARPQRPLPRPRPSRCGYTQRWQVETVNSMVKRNLGSALRGRTAWSRKRDIALKSLTHDLMILAKL